MFGNLCERMYTKDERAFEIRFIANISLEGIAVNEENTSFIGGKIYAL